jgi:hypothetical protein
LALDCCSWFCVLVPALERTALLIGGGFVGTGGTAMCSSPRGLLAAICDYVVFVTVRMFAVIGAGYISQQIARWWMHA